MNVHSIVNTGVKTINPNVTVVIKQSAGYVQNPDLSRTPQFTETQRTAQVQPVSSDDIRMIEGLNIQGYKRHVWVNGGIDGIVRGEQKGGDFIITPDGSVWKIAYVSEAWPDWCSAIVVLQVDSIR